MQTLSGSLAVAVLTEVVPFCVPASPAGFKLAKRKINANCNGKSVLHLGCQAGLIKY